ncbi:MAG: DUF418 domain-containing protein [Alphaproteobacteria bacterium]|nr:MAG: DUF418 domain-containing protein [Alphaproteobacteria bacterium]
MTDTAIATPSARALAPVLAKDRIFNLDMLRGFAVLGILAVNAMAFAWPIDLQMSEAARPFALTGANGVGHWVVDIFFYDKFRTLFTMLFGVSVFLVGGDGSDPARGKLLVRRLLWLLVFGAIHGLAFWFGDILLHYAYCGLIMMLMRRWSAKRLLWIGGGISLLWGLVAVGFTLLFANLGPQFEEAMKAGQPQITPADVMATVEIYRTGVLGALTENAEAWGMLQLVVSPILIPITVPLMMLGLGLFKSGFLSGRSPVWVYSILIAAAAANLGVFGIVKWGEMNGQTFSPGGLGEAAGGLAPLITLGYASLLILMARFGLKPLVAVFVPVGRMAFTNYLTQTLIMVTLFYAPWGPKWFGTMEPAALWGVVGAIWVAQIVWSPLWLSRFQMGPFEWAWRCLTYGRRVPLRKGAAA